MTAPYDVKAIWDAVERVARDSSESYTEGEREMVGWLTEHLGLRRAPEAYSARSRRRYRAASREGITAREQNAREYARDQARKRGEAPPKRAGETNSRKLTRLIRRRNELLPESPVDRESVDEYVAVFGEGNVIWLLEDQIDSVQAWQRYDSRPGRRRWLARDPTAVDRVRGDFDTYIYNTDIMYYYHGRRL